MGDGEKDTGDISTITFDAEYLKGNKCKSP